MYSFKIEKEAKELSMATSTFIRQAIIEKINYKNRFDKIEKRIEKLENREYIDKNKDQLTEMAAEQFADLLWKTWLFRKGVNGKKTKPGQNSLN